MMLRDFIAGVVVDDGRSAEGVRAVIFDDSAFYDFYSSQQISDGTYVELTGIEALYRSMREFAVPYTV